MIPLIVKPKVATLRATEKVVPLAESILSKIQNKSIVSDVAFFHGRRFKVGWNYSNRLTVLTTASTSTNRNQSTDISNLSNLFNGRKFNDTSKSAIKYIKIFSLKPIERAVFDKSIENHLQCQLDYSERRTIDESDCPYYVSINGSDNNNRALQAHYQLAEENSREFPLDYYQKICLNVWSLCVSLWGDQEELEDISEDNHIAIMLRRDLFSKWIEETVTEKDLLKRSESEIGYLPHLLKLLTSHKIDEACELSFNNMDMNLSLLLSQSGGNNVVRALIAKQLQSWHETEADKFVDVHRLKSMMLISGLAAYESSNGLVNIYEKLDWIKCLAVSQFI